MRFRSAHSAATTASKSCRALSPPNKEARTRGPPSLALDNLTPLSADPRAQLDEFDRKRDHRFRHEPKGTEQLAPHVRSSDTREPVRPLASYAHPHSGASSRRRRCATCTRGPGYLSKPESSMIGSIPSAYCAACKPIRRRNARSAGTLQSPLTDSNRRPPPTMRPERQPVATHGNGFPYLSRFFGFSICHRLPPVAPALLHKCSIRGRP
jgi:hypothetical protein